MRAARARLRGTPTGARGGRLLSIRAGRLLIEALDEVAELRSRLAERDREEARLRTMLAEKELLLAELGHRAGNNLQAIIALIRFASRSITDPDTRSRVDELAERVAKIGLIQRLLGEAGQRQGVDAGFLGEVAEAVRATYGADGVELALAIEPVLLKPNPAVALGLLVNEAMSNAFKHAFASTEQPRITVTLRPARDGAELVVEDNGGGLGPGRDGSMGLQLMQTLARQIRGEIAIEVPRGTRVTVAIPAAALAFPETAPSPEPETLAPLGPGPADQRRRNQVKTTGSRNPIPRNRAR